MKDEKDMGFHLVTLSPCVTLSSSASSSVLRMPQRRTGGDSFGQHGNFLVRAGPGRRRRCRLLVATVKVHLPWRRYVEHTDSGRVVTQPAQMMVAPFTRRRGRTHSAMNT